MRTRIALSLLIASGSIGYGAADHDRRAFKGAVTFSTLATTPLAIEGLTGDDAGNLYTTGRAA
jgi:hypothetical protein